MMKSRITNMNYVKVFALLMVVFALGSCKESWLSPEPLSFYSPENTYNRSSGLWAAIVACERNMRHEFTGEAPPLLTEHIFRKWQ